jgi:hypothetical protein
LEEFLSLLLKQAGDINSENIGFTKINNVAKNEKINKNQQNLIIKCRI